MILKRNVFIGILFSVCIGALISLFFFAHQAKANPSSFTRKQAATATTTLTFMTPGTATTTAIIDCQLGGSTSFGCDSGALMVNFTASSSVSTLLINQEYAQGTSGVDCVATPLACDWYEGNQGLVNGNFATSTNPLIFNIALIPQYSFVFASSTIGGQALSTSNNLTSRLVSFQSPTRYTRFIFSLKVQANGNGAVWWDIATKKQNN